MPTTTMPTTTMPKPAATTGQLSGVRTLFARATLAATSAVAILACLVLAPGCRKRDDNRSRPADTSAADTPDTPALPAEFPASEPGSFADNPIVYFVITDRFFNGNRKNDTSYGRERPADPFAPDAVGHFHGGDLTGLTRKLADGWFRDLGVNAIWITAPYEQIHGWVVGGDKAFRHYAYHGYYALDYTALDRNMGSEDDLAKFVAAAHERGIRVIFDVVMNHPGYADLQTLSELAIPVLWPGWQKATPSDYHSFIDYNNFAFEDWWGPAWVRSDLPGYKPGPSHDELRKQLAYLPDFKTESKRAVDVPAFFANKKDTAARTVPGYKVRDYLVAWLTAWVREFGIDGFRCDTAKHVDLASWAALERAATEALAGWKAASPEPVVDDAPFWMTAEVFPHGVERTAYFDHGFDNVINFDLQERALAITSGGAPGPGRAGGAIALDALDAMYAEYAGKLAGADGFNVLSYLSSHDTALFPRDRLIAGGTVLLLAPGGVQIFYGDETARPPGHAPPSDPQQATRSSMRWDAIDRDVLAHWQALTRFRARHVALAKGAHVRLTPPGAGVYAFARLHPRDRVVVAIVSGSGGAPDGADAAAEPAGSPGAIRVPVARAFADGTAVRDAYTGAGAEVTGGHVAVRPGPRGVVLLEKAP